jgi:flavocytochrome c
MTITYALMEKLEAIIDERPDLAQIRYKAHVKTLLRSENQSEVIGVEYEDLTDGTKHQLYGPVVLATGGYAADFTSDSLLKKYRPDIYNLPTTNGDYSTGDGHKMTLAIGGNAIDLEKVQVHPTGLVHPDEPNAKVLFLAAEALRGVGGLLLTNDGQRFCDELGHRDYVTGKMWEYKKGPYRLLLNGAASKEIEWHCKHYMGRGLMKHFKSGAEVAKEMGIAPSVLEATFKSYNDVMQTKKCPFGKKYFSNGPWQMNDEFYIAIVTPVLHYTMGGVEINGTCEVQSSKGTIPGLYAAGELAGGVHGANRLGGSSLLGCVVFGRVAGDAASSYLLNSLSTGQTSAPGAAAGGALKLEIEPSGNGRVVVTWGGAKASSSAATASSSAAPAAKKADAAAPAQEAQPYKEYSLEDVAKHNSEKDCWVVVDGQVLDVTKFLPDHPGGKKAVLIYAGKDATAEFLMMHKLDVIPRYAPYTVIGKIKGSNPSPAGMVSRPKL